MSEPFPNPPPQFFFFRLEKLQVNRPAFRFAKLSYVIFCCLCVACSGNVAGQAPPPGGNQSVVQSNPGQTVKPSSTAANGAIRVFFAASTTGHLSEAVLEDPAVSTQVGRAQYPVPLPNGGAVTVEVETGPDATVVMVDTKSSITDLQKVGSGRWRAVLQYYDTQNTGDPHSSIIVRVASPRASVEKVVSVLTLHDS